MTRWNLTAMGQSGLTGVTASAAKPIAASISRKTGRPEGQVLAIIGAVFLAVSLIDFLRTVDTAVAAAKTISPIPIAQDPSSP